jgi:hypothetical protein
VRLVVSCETQEDTLRRATALLPDCGNAYLSASDRLRRTDNQAWFSHLFVEGDDETRQAVNIQPEPTELFATLGEIVNTVRQRNGGLTSTNEESDRFRDRSLTRAPGLDLALLVALSARLSNIGDELQRLLALAGTERPAVRPGPPPSQREPQRHLTATEVERLVVAYRLGATVYELADHYGCRRATVSAHLKRAGVTLRLRSPASAEIDDAIRLYQAGQSLAAVGRTLGFSTKTIHNALIARSVPRRDTHGRIS